MGFTLSRWGGLRLNLQQSSCSFKQLRKPKILMKTMKMNKESKSTRAGIYAQKSAEVTAVGDGLASEEEKSPVIIMKHLKTDKIYENEENITNEEDNVEAATDSNIEELNTPFEEEPIENHDQDETPNELIEELNTPFEEEPIENHDQDETPNDSAEIQSIEKHEQEHENENEKNNAKEEDKLNEDEDTKADKYQNENKSEPKENNNTNLEEQNPPFEEFIEKHDQDKTPNDSVEINQDDFDDEGSHHGSANHANTSVKRNECNQLTTLKEFPRCEKYIGTKSWRKALTFLKKIGYVSWEINTMFEALDNSIDEKMIKRKTPEKESPQEIPTKKPRLENKKEPKVISGILLPNAKIPKILQEPEKISPYRILEKDDPGDEDNGRKYSTFDLRASIGDASQPNFSILNGYEKKLRYALFNLIDAKGPSYNPDVPIGIVNSHFVNHILIVECRNVQTLIFIQKNLRELNNLYPKADLALLPRYSSRKSIQICIPYQQYEVPEILEIIGKQNRLRVENWKVNELKKTENGVCLDVEVNGGTYLRLIKEQDDVFFLMKRATIKLPVND